VKSLSIYIHIPYCDHKCIYCDFYSIINSKNKPEYLNGIKREIEYYAGSFKDEYQIDTIFFGGGTPSLMDVSYIEEILNSVSKNFAVSESAEITLETNPGTVSREKLSMFRQIGINRISIGVQSFDDDDLKFLTRIHTGDEAVKTVRDAENVGFRNISIDLIFNLPRQTKEKWKSNLRKAVSLPVQHISAYSLILERGTILNKMVLDGEVEIGDESFDADLYQLTQNFLINNGFVQYEVSNFALPGFECKHNQQYWNYGDYVGIGTAAHSFVNGKRWWNYKSLTYYLKSVKEKGNAIAGSEVLTNVEMLEEYVMLALRGGGLDIKSFECEFSSEWMKTNNSKIIKYKKLGLLEITSENIKLTKQGYALCDEILTEFDY
jgi:oxygen-independent coproporphyrinogen-3 oxidase